MTSTDSILTKNPISPSKEMAAYEALWSHSDASFKTVADCFRKSPGTTPSELVTEEEINDAHSFVMNRIEKAKIHDFGVCLYGTNEYPQRLRDATHPVELLYFRGWWDLIESPKSIAIVGSRTPTEEGNRRTKKLVKLLVKQGFTIVSGLAKGVDTIAHNTAIEQGGSTIAVIGTPITEYYPAENKELQDYIADKHLLVSQVPIWRYSKQDYRINRLFFPERNATMSAIAQATVIVEASDTSGTLTQAKAALHQGRKLFILDNCFHNTDITWPSKFEKLGAIRVRDIDDIKAALG